MLNRRRRLALEHMQDGFSCLAWRVLLSESARGGLTRCLVMAMGLRVRSRTGQGSPFQTWPTESGFCSAYCEEYID